MSKTTFWLIIAAYIVIAVVYWPIAVGLLIGDAISCKIKGFSLLAIVKSAYRR